MARARPARVSTARILADLRLAGKKGDRSALTLALDGMRVLAHSPRYWDKYLALLRNPLARLVDLLVVKQGEKIAHQKAWQRGRRGGPPPSATALRPRRRGTTAPAKGMTPRAGTSSATSQPALFD